MLIKITRKRKNNKITKNEFDITKMILDAFNCEYESDYSITIENAPLLYSDRVIAFPEHYSYINSDLNKDMILFRPLKNERHSNILIDMFEDYFMSEPMDSLEINEFLNDKNKKRYTGHIIVNGKLLKRSYIKSSPTIPVLKTSIIAKLLFNKDDYYKYKDKLNSFLYEQKGYGGSNV